ncbi:MAG TPA: regulatory protein RecX, partial [Bacteroidota bacterium]|nr:regulatory protein RecX [Bacteroidota bacterium]
VGDELSPSGITALTAEETLYQARSSALRLLARRPRAERELRDRLRENEFDDDTIGRVIAGLTEAGLVNDGEFARMYVRNALTLRPQGELQLRQKLLLLGVARPLIDDVLREILSGVDEEQMALTLARRYIAKSRSGASPDDQRKRRQRVTAMLARRGYAWTVINRVLKSLDLSTAEDPHEL